MDCQEAQLYFLEYLRGELPDDLQNAIEEHLKQDTECQEHFEEVRTTWEDMKDFPLAVPDASLADNFQKMLEEEMAKASTPKATQTGGKVISLGRISAVAASLLLLIVSGWLVWKISSDNNEITATSTEKEIALSEDKNAQETETQLNQKEAPSEEEIIKEELNIPENDLEFDEEPSENMEEIREKGIITEEQRKNLPKKAPKGQNANGANTGTLKMDKTELEDLSDSQSLAFERQETPDIRIKAIYETWENTNQTNFQVIENWLYQLNNDPNPNVRLVAIDVLYSFGEDRQVQSQLINSLNQQNEPLVQIATLEFILEFELKAGKNAVKKLLQREDLHHSVRTFAEITLQKIS